MRTMGKVDGDGDGGGGGSGDGGGGLREEGPPLHLEASLLVSG